MMSAPASASIMPANGDGPNPANSMSRRPASGPLIRHRPGWRRTGRHSVGTSRTCRDGGCSIGRRSNAPVGVGGSQRHNSRRSGHRGSPGLLFGCRRMADGAAAPEGARMSLARRATGPGRVNLIGDHTDYNRGLALPIAIDLGTTVEFTPTGSSGITFFSTLHRQGITLPLGLPPDPEVVGTLEPSWARLVAGVIATVGPEIGGVCRIVTTLPVGAGLSSSAALATALAKVFGATGSPMAVAKLCQQAENLSGVPVGIMDPLVCAGGWAGSASLIDFSTLSVEYVPIPGSAEIVVVDSGQHRALRDTEY